MIPVSGTGGADRVVVLHGRGDPATVAALRAVGLEVRAEIGDTTVWAPPDRDRPTRPEADLHTREGRPLLLSVAEAAAALGVGRTTAYELIAAGQLETVHIGRCARVPVAAVQELVDRLRRRDGGGSQPERRL